MRPEPDPTRGSGALPGGAGMSSARVDYIAPWWTYWLHNFPHLNLFLQPVDGTFRPAEESYQQVGHRDSPCARGNFLSVVVARSVTTEPCARDSGVSVYVWFGGNYNNMITS